MKIEIETETEKITCVDEKIIFCSLKKNIYPCQQQQSGGPQNLQPGPQTTTITEKATANGHAIHQNLKVKH